MLTLLMYVVFVGLVAAALFFVASAIFGRGEELGPLPEGTTATVLPAEGITGADVRALRFQQVVRGYKAAEVDWALARLAARIDELQIELAQARSVPAPRPATGRDSESRTGGTASTPELAKDDAGFNGTAGQTWTPEAPGGTATGPGTTPDNGASSTATGYRYPTAWSATGEPATSGYDQQTTPAGGTPTSPAASGGDTAGSSEQTTTGWGTPLSRDEPAAPAAQPGATPSSDRWGIPFNLASEPAEGSRPHRTSGPS